MPKTIRTAKEFIAANKMDTEEEEYTYKSTKTTINNRNTQEAEKVMKNEYEELNGAGSFKANKSIKCPFPDHNDRTPSFNYTSTKGLWHCFGCDRGGDVVKFVQLKEGLNSRREVSEYILRKYGFTLKPVKVPVNTSKILDFVKKDSVLAEVIDRANKNLLSDIDSDAYKYLMSRGISGKTIAEHKIGFMGNSSCRISKLLAGIATHKLISEGILVFRKNSEYGYFADRIIIPYYYNGIPVDIHGRYIKNISAVPKLLKRKGISVPYILGPRKENTKDYVILTEGDFDYLTLIETGFNAKLCSQYSDDGIIRQLQEYEKIYICMDNDDAGIKKSLNISKRIIEVLGKKPEEFFLILLPKEKDVHKVDINEFYLRDKKNFSDSFRELMDKSGGMFEFIVNINSNSSENVLRDGIKSVSDFYNLETLKKSLTSILNKQRFDIELIKKIINEIEAEKEKFIIDEAFEGVETTDCIKELNLSQDFLNAEMYYGFLNRTSNKAYLINSNRDLTCVEEARTAGINIKQKELFQSTLKGLWVKAFIKEHELKIDAKNLIARYKEILEKYIYFENKKMYSLVSVWTLGTYVFRIFNYYPYLWINADKGSGKSKLLKMISQIAFNSTLVNSSSSIAALRRKMDNCTPTTLIDEFEFDKTIKQEIIAILNDGFQKGAISSICEASKDGIYKPYDFGVYCPKVIAGINDIMDTLKDRCLRINMIKRPKELERNRYINDSEFQSQIDEIVRDSYYFGLQYGEKIYDIYKTGNFKLPGLLQDREKDLWEPLYCIGEIIKDLGNASILEDLDKISKESSLNRKTDNIFDNTACKIVVMLNTAMVDLPAERVDEYGNRFISMMYLYKYITTINTSSPDKPDDIRIDVDSSEALGRILKNTLGLEQKTLNKKRCYKLSEKILRELNIRFDIPKEYIKEGLL